MVNGKVVALAIAAFFVLVILISVFTKKPTHITNTLVATAPDTPSPATVPGTPSSVAAPPVTAPEMPPEPAVWQSWPPLQDGNYYVKRTWSPATSPKPSGPEGGAYIKYAGCYSGQDLFTIDTSVFPPKPIRTPPIPNKSSGPITFDECYKLAASKNAPFFGLQYWGLGPHPAAENGTIGDCYYANPGSDINKLMLANAGDRIGGGGNCKYAKKVMKDLDGTGAKAAIVGGPNVNAVYNIFSTPQ